MMSLADVRSTNMLEIVRAMESVLGVRGNYRVLDQGSAFPIDTLECQRAASRCGVSLGDGYLLRLLRKYYGASSSD